MSGSSDVVVGSHHQDDVVYMSVKLPRGMNMEEAQTRLGRLTWVQDIRHRGEPSSRTLLIQPNTPTANNRQFERRASAIANALFGLNGFSGSLTITSTGH